MIAPTLLLHVHASVPLARAGWPKERGMRVDPMREGVELAGSRPFARVAWALLWLALAEFTAKFGHYVYLK